MAMNRRMIINYIRDNFNDITGVNTELGIYFTIPATLLAEATELDKYDFMNLVRGDE